MIREDVARYIKSLAEGGCWAKANRFRRQRTGAKVVRWLEANDPGALTTLNIALQQFGSASEILESGWLPINAGDQELLMMVSDLIRNKSLVDFT